MPRPGRSTRPRRSCSAHIASVHSAAENDFLRDTMYPSGHFWIGYKQRGPTDRSSSFHWSDGTTGPHAPWTGSFESYDSFVAAGDDIANAVPLPISCPQGASPRRFKIEFRTGSSANMVLLSTGTGVAKQAFNVRLSGVSTWA